MPRARQVTACRRPGRVPPLRVRATPCRRAPGRPRHVGVPLPVEPERCGVRDLGAGDLDERRRVEHEQERPCGRAPSRTSESTTPVVLGGPGRVERRGPVRPASSPAAAHVRLVPSSTSTLTSRSENEVVRLSGVPTPKTWRYGRPRRCSYAIRGELERRRAEQPVGHRARRRAGRGSGAARPRASAVPVRAARRGRTGAAPARPGDRGEVDEQRAVVLERVDLVVAEEGRGDAAAHDRAARTLDHGEAGAPVGPPVVAVDDRAAGQQRQGVREQRVLQQHGVARRQGERVHVRRPPRRGDAGHQPALQAVVGELVEVVGAGAGRTRR